VPRLLIAAGAALIVLGAAVALIARFNPPVGRLPGDLVWRSGRTTIYFPWVTCLLLSALGTLLLWLLSRR
jgi:hypothetical protein